MSHLRFAAPARVRALLAMAVAAPLALTLPTGDARNLRNIDALSDAPVAAKSLVLLPIPAEALKTANAESRTSVDSRLGVPTFFWGDSDGRAAAMAANSPSARARSSDPVATARAYLSGLSAQYRLSSTDVAGVPHLLTQTMPNGAALVKFRNRINDSRQQRRPHHSARAIGLSQ